MPYRRKAVFDSAGRVYYELVACRPEDLDDVGQVQYLMLGDGDQPYFIGLATIVTDEFIAKALWHREQIRASLGWDRLNDLP